MLGFLKEIAQENDYAFFHDKIFHCNFSNTNLWNYPHSCNTKKNGRIKSSGWMADELLYRNAKVWLSY